MGNTFNAVKAVDYALLSVGATTALGLDSASPALNLTTGQVGGVKIHRAVFSIEDQGCRWRPDGTDPTITEGHEMADTDTLSFMDANYIEVLKAIKFIALTGTCLIRITYFD